MELSPRFYEAVNAFISDYKIFISGFLGLVTALCIVFFVYNLAALGTSTLHSELISRKKREQAIVGLLTSGISIMIMGSIDFIYALFLKTIVLS